MGIQRFGSPAAFIQITPVVTIIFLVLRHLKYSYSHLRVCSERHFIWPGTEEKVAKQPVLKTLSLCAQKKVSNKKDKLRRMKDKAWSVSLASSRKKASLLL